MTFTERCAQPGVVKCVGFDSAADFSTGSGGTNGAYGFNSGIIPPSGTSDYTRATMDTAVKASGNGSLRFTIPSNSGSDTSGTYFTNFSTDLSVQFGENAEFFVQWRQRFSPEFISTKYTGGGGWKQVIMGTRRPGGNKIYASCIVARDGGAEPLPEGLPEDVQLVHGLDLARAVRQLLRAIRHLRLQAAERPSGARTACTRRARARTSRPTGNCFGYVPNEWMTFQVRIKIGPRVGDEFTNSYVTLWVAREGKASELVIDWGPYNLTAGSLARTSSTARSGCCRTTPARTPPRHIPTAYTWYDELIISRNKIADP